MLASTLAQALALEALARTEGRAQSFTDARLQTRECCCRASPEHSTNTD